MPITSDGKAPDLEPFLDNICEAVQKAVNKAHRPNSRDPSMKAIVLDNLDDAVNTVSGDQQFRFNQRQVFYVLRDIVMKELGKELKEGNFNGIITDYEAEHGEIRLMYREPRGSIYHPHTGQTLVLGTLSVERYQRPAWLFNKLVYIEKEGWLETLKAIQWPERHDCAVASTKGFTTRAIRDLVDKLAEHDEPIVVFCVHDADAYGTMIYQTFQEATNARGARKIKVVNIGLEPHLVGAALTLAAAQRLVRKLCVKCKELYTPTAVEQAHFDFLPTPPTTLYRGAGCSACRNTGYMGRSAVYELFPITAQVRQMIYDRADLETLRRHAAEAGMDSLRRSGLRKVADHITTLEEVLTTCIAEE